VTRPVKKILWPPDSLNARVGTDVTAVHSFQGVSTMTNTHRLARSAFALLAIAGTAALVGCSANSTQGPSRGGGSQTPTLSAGDGVGFAVFMTRDARRARGHDVGPIQTAGSPAAAE